MSFLIFFFFCFNSSTDLFCLALLLQAMCLWRPALRSRHDSLTFFSRYAIIFIMFLMLILCLILLSSTVHAFGHKAEWQGNTKGRGNRGGVELSIRSRRQKKNNIIFFILEEAVGGLLFPLGCASKNVSVRKQDVQSLLFCLLSLPVGSFVVTEVTHPGWWLFTKLKRRFCRVILLCSWPCRANQ